MGDDNVADNPKPVPDPEIMAGWDMAILKVVKENFKQAKAKLKTREERISTEHGGRKAVLLQNDWLVWDTDCPDQVLETAWRKSVRYWSTPGMYGNPDIIGVPIVAYPRLKNLSPKPMAGADFIAALRLLAEATGESVFTRAADVAGAYGLGSQNVTSCANNLAKRRNVDGYQRAARNARGYEMEGYSKERSAALAAIVLGINGPSFATVIQYIEAEARLPLSTSTEDTWSTAYDTGKRLRVRFALEQNPSVPLIENGIKFDDKLEAEVPDNAYWRWQIRRGRFLVVEAIW